LAKRHGGLGPIDGEDEQAIAELEAYAEQLAKRHGGLGPIDGEDEQP
jgi:hypothetical protein